MTTQAQNFNVTAGDDEVVTFCIVGPDNQPLDISGVANIEWTALFDANNKLTKSLGAGIALVGGGTTGQFAVTLNAADTAPWFGPYPHQATLIDDIGKRSTVTDGTMIVEARITP